MAGVATPHTYPLCHCDPVLDAGVGNLVALAMVVCQRVFSLNEIATWFDRLTMSGCAPRNDSRPVWFDKVGTREVSTRAIASYPRRTLSR